MGAHQKSMSAQPIPWFFSKKKSAHGLGWAGLGRAGLGEAQPIRSPGVEAIKSKVSFFSTKCILYALVFEQSV